MQRVGSDLVVETAHKDCGFSVGHGYDFLCEWKEGHANRSSLQEEWRTMMYHVWRMK